MAVGIYKFSSPVPYNVLKKLFLLPLYSPPYHMDLEGPRGVLVLDLHYTVENTEARDVNGLVQVHMAGSWPCLDYNLGLSRWLTPSKGACQCPTEFLIGLGSFSQCSEKLLF